MNKDYAVERAFILSRMISKYPVLADVVRKKMRKILEKEGVVSGKDLVDEAKLKAMIDQRKEGLTDPVSQESAERWEARVREHLKQLTDYYFALHFSIEDALNIIEDVKITNLQLQELLEREDSSFELIKRIEEAKKDGDIDSLDDDPELEHLKVNVIRNFISDNLDFISIAKRFFTFKDLQEIKARIIGSGKIGGKAAGLLLAYSVLKKNLEKSDMDEVRIPACYFLGSEVFYRFFEHNGALDFQSIKYLPLEEVEKRFSDVEKEIMSFSFPDDIVLKLRSLVNKFRGKPMIVRSSSLLEDNVKTSFAGKYTSVFVSNSGDTEENLNSILNAVKRVYASVFSPDAIAYRREKKLLDYDEKMAVLIQNVVGEKRDNYFFPFLAGVGFSFNMFKWNRRIKVEDGLLRLVLGLGTRAVERIGNDYPRMVALSEPLLRPEKDIKDIKRYSQKFVDALNLESKKIEKVSIRKAISLCSREEKNLAFQFDVGGYFGESFFQSQTGIVPVLTFTHLFKRTDFIDVVKKVLKFLKKGYGMEVDIEFACLLNDRKDIEFFLLQCRPLSIPGVAENIRLPSVKSKKYLLFDTKGISPCGVVKGVKYIVYVSPNEYERIDDNSVKIEIGKIVGFLNRKLPHRSFVLIGPGRWGTTDLKLGVKVGYGDINNAAVLIELARVSEVYSTEVSYGTHFYQDLVEANIYPLSIYLDREETFFNTDFIVNSENRLSELLKDYKDYSGVIKVIDVERETHGRLLEIYMSLKKNRAIGVFRK